MAIDAKPVKLSIGTGGRNLATRQGSIITDNMTSDMFGAIFGFGHATVCDV